MNDRYWQRRQIHKDRIDRKVHADVARHPDTYQDDTARRLGMRVFTVCDSCVRLMEKGLVGVAPEAVR